jgi:hypothetical protein
MVKTLIYLFIEELYFWVTFWYREWPKILLRKFFDFLANLDHEYGLRAHLRNFFVPLYGQKDFVSLIISVIYRSIIFFFNLILIIFFGIFLFLFIAFWFILPFYLLIVIIFNNALFL